MSHVTTCELRVKDIDALEAAANSLGLDLIRDQKEYRWYGQYVGDYNDDLVNKFGIDPSEFGKCDHVLTVRGDCKAYEVGVVKAKDGDGFVLLYDFYSKGR